MIAISARKRVIIVITIMAITIMHAMLNPARLMTRR